MTQFKVGDRVAVYECFARHVGIITGMTKKTSFYVRLDGFDDGCAYHPKQCRRLVKKKRRSVWVKPESYDGTGLHCVPWECDGWIEFSEVKK